jgi:hypothetical protein
LNFLHGLELPKRRDVKAMTQLLADVAPPERIQATFKSEQYGVFKVAGPVVKSASTGSMAVGSLFIESRMKPEKNLQLLQIDSLDDTDAGAADLLAAANGEAGTADVIANLSHGDLVEADFEMAPYGRFTVTGAAIWAPVAGFFMLGSLILSKDGAPAARVAGARLLAGAGTHHLSVPEPIRTWQFHEGESL